MSFVGGRNDSIRLNQMNVLDDQITKPSPTQSSLLFPLSILDNSTTTSPSSSPSSSSSSNSIFFNNFIKTNYDDYDLDDQQCIYFKSFLFESDRNEQLFGPKYSSFNDQSIHQLFQIWELSGTKRTIIKISLSFSTLALLTTFLIYCALPKLRTVPGKCLMGLIANEFFGSIYLIILIHTRNNLSPFFCSFLPICLHFFFLSHILWTNLIAFDIWRKIRLPTRKLRGSIRYFLIGTILPFAIVSMNVVLDFTKIIPSVTPIYGGNGCGISNLFIHFYIIFLPVMCSSLFNFFILIITIYHLKSLLNSLAGNIPVSREISNNHRKCFWYIQLSVLLGGLNFFATIINLVISGCQLANFISLLILSTHGTFIFIAFGCRKSHLKMLYRKLFVAKSSAIKSSSNIAQQRFRTI
ncbi:secretin receptor-like [Sarcoptes scabiei]|nr:secretin receptor-like [Sarcoptes scabiei]